MLRFIQFMVTGEANPPPFRIARMPSELFAPSTGKVQGVLGECMYVYLCVGEYICVQNGLHNLV